MSKLFLPLLGLCIVWYISTVRLKLSPTEDLSLRKPPLLSLLGWVLVWILWMATTDWWLQWRGPWDFTPWQKQPLWLSAVRLLSVCLVGPLLEELVFRGLLFVQLSRWALNRWVITLLLSGLWAVIHVEYGWPIIGMLFINGCLLTLALIQSRSLLIPVLLHMLWNLYAIW